MNQTTEEQLNNIITQQNAAIITMAKEIAQIKNELTKIKTNNKTPAILEFYEIKLDDYGAKQRLTTTPLSPPCLPKGKNFSPCS
jgi:ribosome recycling factor